MEPLTLNPHAILVGFISYERNRNLFAILCSGIYIQISPAYCTLIEVYKLLGDIQQTSLVTAKTFSSWNKHLKLYLNLMEVIFFPLNCFNLYLTLLLKFSACYNFWPV